MQRLLAGPMWSGCDPQDIRNPLKVRGGHFQITTETTELATMK